MTGLGNRLECSDELERVGRCCREASGEPRKRVVQVGEGDEGAVEYVGKDETEDVFEA